MTTFDELFAEHNLTPKERKALVMHLATLRAQKTVEALQDGPPASAPSTPPTAVVEAVPPGLSLTQEPKYTVNGSAIVNRASGEAIPADEPVFIFRARDVHAREAIEAYTCVLTPGEHRDAVVQRVADFAAFSYAHPSRMKEPDTDRGIAPKAAQEKT